ncbi:hypothetical protein GCM10010349_31120 [Streptomyces flavofungini]|uniref:Secreted protein n=1 Tax=Streptomyces flavofungini TaxID=68200 RepID=A0ABS0X0G6_9ACTN|nr:hypothetical protein [Streptomyces flavofungini]GHC61331.1 hypothetical protein GCM10010349_31120 [Streptomyces flavofungini]
MRSGPVRHLGRLFQLQLLLALLSVAPPFALLLVGTAFSGFAQVSAAHSPEPVHGPLIPKWMCDELAARRQDKRGSRDEWGAAGGSSAEGGTAHGDVGPGRQGHPPRSVGGGLGDCRGSAGASRSPRRPWQATFSPATFAVTV